MTYIVTSLLVYVIYAKMSNKMKVFFVKKISKFQKEAIKSNNVNAFAKKALKIKTLNILANFGV